MHDRGFTHRDIKVENIMLDSMRTPILMDFGSVGPGKFIMEIKWFSFMIFSNFPREITL